MIKLKVNSIFESISGEAGGFLQGSWCTFVRLQGCSLRCKWCDTSYAQDLEGGTIMSLDQIITCCQMEKVLITGGEPLVQRDDVLELIEALLFREKIIQIETNGAHHLGIHKKTWGFSQSVFWVVDYKCPSSGVALAMCSPRQFVEIWRDTNMVVKFVVDAIDDLSYAVGIMKEMWGEGYKGRFIISPLDAKGVTIPLMAEYIRDQVGKGMLDRVVFSIQLHKIVNLP